MGAGRTLPMYDPSKVKRLVGIEPNAKLASVAVETGEALPFPVEVSQSGAEEMDDFEDATFDTILSSAVMCSVPDLEGALAECRRVLKPSGKLVFAEHGRSPDRFQYLLQRLEEPIHRTFVGGCHMTREIPKAITSAGFRVSLDHEGYVDTRAYPKFMTWSWTGRATPH